MADVLNVNRLVLFVLYILIIGHLRLEEHGVHVDHPVYLAWIILCLTIISIEIILIYEAWIVTRSIREKVRKPLLKTEIKETNRPLLIIAHTVADKVAIFI